MRKSDVYKRQECYRLKSQIEKLEEHRESQISYMWNEYEITPNNALQYKKEELNDLKSPYIPQLHLH